LPELIKHIAAIAEYSETGMVTGKSASDERAIPAVDPHAPLTPKVLNLVAVLSVDEKISLVHGAQDPASLGQAGYLPGVPRLGIPPRRDADALGINVTADPQPEHSGCLRPGLLAVF